MYKNYIFDLYGTLLDIHTNESKKYLWEKMAAYYSFHGAAYTSSELKKEYLNICKQEEKKLPHVDYPEIEITSVFQQLYKKKGIETDQLLANEAGKVFRVLSTEYIRLYDGVLEVLESLKKAGKKIYLLSNAQRIFTEPEMQMLKIYHYFDGVLFSSDEGCKKPSPLFYQALLDKYQLDKRKSIMIGNDPIADIKGAHDIGIDSLYIHSNLSPKEPIELLSNYSVMNGDVYQILKVMQ